MAEQENDVQEFRIYKVEGAKLKGKAATAWEVVMQLKVGEAVKLPMSLRFKMIERAAETGISIRTIKSGSDQVEVIRIEKREKKK